MNKRLKDKKCCPASLLLADSFIILAGSALSQQTALGQNYQGVYVDGTFVGYVAENVDVKDVILQARRRKLAEESASRLCMDYEWSVKTEKKTVCAFRKKETLEEQLKKILAEKTIEKQGRPIQLRSMNTAPILRRWMSVEFSGKSQGFRRRRMKTGRSLLISDVGGRSGNIDS